MNSFLNFQLLPSIQSTLAENELTEPTEIQTRTVPVLIDGRGVVGVAETGSGKTLAYVLPVLHLLKSMENDGHPVNSDARPRALIIVPTRELGDQVVRVFKPFTHTTRLRVRTVLGGMPRAIMRRNLAGHFEILVATPGRALQMLDQKLLKLDDVRILVFDEADQMLDQGFLAEANRIVHACPPERQMVLFAATVSPQVQKLINTLFSTAEVIRSKGSHRLVPTLTTNNRSLPDGKRFPLLVEILRNRVDGGTLIFTNTREQCDKLAEELQNNGHQCAICRGDMDKSERRANMKAFREGEIELLIATDLASRGLDLERVDRVINYHLPRESDNYLHRAGRTARAGRKGLVINFVTERDQPLMRRLESIQAIRGPTPKKK